MKLRYFNFILSDSTQQQQILPWTLPKRSSPCLPVDALSAVEEEEVRLLWQVVRFEHICVWSLKMEEEKKKGYSQCLYCVSLYHFKDTNSWTLVPFYYSKSNQGTTQISVRGCVCDVFPYEYVWSLMPSVFGISSRGYWSWMNLCIFSGFYTAAVCSSNLLHTIVSSDCLVYWLVIKKWLVLRNCCGMRKIKHTGMCYYGKITPLIIFIFFVLWLLLVRSHHLFDFWHEFITRMPFLTQLTRLGTSTQS